VDGFFFSFLPVNGTLFFWKLLSLCVICHHVSLIEDRAETHHERNHPENEAAGLILNMLEKDTFAMVEQSMGV
jgi:hypothetical protein